MNLVKWLFPNTYKKLQQLELEKDQLESQLKEKDQQIKSLTIQYNNLKQQLTNTTQMLGSLTEEERIKSNNLERKLNKLTDDKDKLISTLLSIKATINLLNLDDERKY